MAQWNKDTIFEVASMAKPFVAVAVLKVLEKNLIEIGAPNLNAALNRPVYLLKGMEDLGRVPQPGDTVPNANPYKKQQITLRHLLTHTSSLRWIGPYATAGVLPANPQAIPPGTSPWVGSPGLSNEQVYDATTKTWIPARKASLAQVASHIMRQKLLDVPPGNPDLSGQLNPGTFALYSSYGYVLAARVVEAYSGGKKFEDYLKEQIFEPLGMLNTACTTKGWDLLKRQRIAPVMSLTPPLQDGKRKLPPDVAPPLNSSDFTAWDKERAGWTYVWPEGGLYSTASDLLTFLRMLRQEGQSDSGKQVLSKEAMSLIYQNQYTVPPLVQTLRPGGDRERGKTIAFDLNGTGGPPGMPKNCLVHGGRFMTRFWIDPRKQGLSGVFLSQRMVSVVTDPKDATGEYLLFLDPDLEPLEKNWLTAMAEQLSNPRVGAVGARIISPEKTVESAGLILSPDGTVVSAFAGCARDFRGANRQLQGVRNYSAVSGSCLLTRKDLVDRLLLDSASGSLNFARDDRVCRAVEFCLALREQGLRTVSVPYAELRRASTKQAASVACPDLQKRWPEMFRRDPCYNPNLASGRADFSLGTQTN